MQLRLAGDSGGARRIESIDFSPDAQSVYLAVSSAPGEDHLEAAPGTLQTRSLPSFYP